MNNLKVFDGGLSDPSMEVEHIGLCLLIPGGRLVVEGHQVLHVPILMAGEQSLQLLKNSQRWREKRTREG